MISFKKKSGSVTGKWIGFGIFLLLLAGIGIFGISDRLISYNHQNAAEDLITASEQLNNNLVELTQTASSVLSLQGNAELLKIAERLRNNDTSGLKVVFLTFDDGPSVYTSEVLNILKQYNVQATFFSKGGDTELAQSIWPRLIAEGHTLANHTWSHDYSLYNTPDAFYADVQKEADFQKSITGLEPSGLFRFPGGSLTANKTCAKGILDRGYNYADWNVSSTDAAAVTPSPETIVNAVINGCHNYEVSVVLCHAEVKENTRTALPTIIETLQAEGYVFLPMSKDFTYPRQLEP